ncbi:hypothetical protein GX48_08336 [Paracoccidioides brasiliensis]|nr:hypothetical protein GX48_08336 [Paracoccidioides brasiliensis]
MAPLPTRPNSRRIKLNNPPIPSKRPPPPPPHGPAHTKNRLRPRRFPRRRHPPLPLSNNLLISMPLCAPVLSGLDDPFAARLELTLKNTDGISIVTEQTLERWFAASWWRRENCAEMQRMRALMRTTTWEGFMACCQA